MGDPVVPVLEILEIRPQITLEDLLSESRDGRSAGIVRDEPGKRLAKAAVAVETRGGIAVSLNHQRLGHSVEQEFQVTDVGRRLEDQACERT